MPRIDAPPERLTDYARAVCYHSIPKMATPVSLGLILVYAVLLLEAIALLCYGLTTNSLTYAKWGSTAVFGIVSLGVIAFLMRAFRNEVRVRRMLAAARTLPGEESTDTTAQADAYEIPDPFKDHLLICHPLWTRGDLFPCVDRDGNLLYFVETYSHETFFKVKDAHDEEVVEVRVEGRPASFAMEWARFPGLTVLHNGVELGRIRHVFSLVAPTIQVTYATPDLEPILIQDGAILYRRRVVGRIYYFNRAVYLDIEKEAFNDVLLGFFVTLT